MNEMCVKSRVRGIMNLAVFESSFTVGNKISDTLPFKRPGRDEEGFVSKFVQWWSSALTTTLKVFREYQVPTNLAFVGFE